MYKSRLSQEDLELLKIENADLQARLQGRLRNLISEKTEIDKILNKRKKAVKEDVK